MSKEKSTAIGLKKNISRAPSTTGKDKDKEDMLSDIDNQEGNGLDPDINRDLDASDELVFDNMLDVKSPNKLQKVNSSMGLKKANSVANVDKSNADKSIVDKSSVKKVKDAKETPMDRLLKLEGMDSGRSKKSD